MKGERIDKLFEALKNEVPSVKSNEVLEWLDHQSSVEILTKRKLNFRLTVLLFGVALLGSMLFFLPVKSNPKKVVNHPEKQKLSSVRPERDTNPAQITSSFEMKRTDIEYGNNQILNDSIKISYFEPEIIPFRVEMSLEDDILERKNDFNHSYFDPVKIPSNAEVQDHLFILDSLKNYSRPAARFTMDEPDCYLQIFKDYVVISYRFRNRNYYASGTIHRNETQYIDGQSYKLFAFQSDNDAVSSSFGNRVFFGYREIQNTSNDIEILLFCQPWAPTTILIGHSASPEERRKLVERSKSQE